MLYMQEDVPHGAHMTVKEVAIHISNHTTRVGDRGVVVVGGSVDLGDLAHHGDAGKSFHMCSCTTICLNLDAMQTFGRCISQLPMCLPPHLIECAGQGVYTKLK